MITTLIITGVLTIYAGPYVGQPLYCDGVYDVDNDPWVALPISDLGRTWECGDLVYVTTESGSLMARAMDAGPLSKYTVEGQPIVVDIPSHLSPFDGLSSPGHWVNITRMVREWKSSY